MCIQEPRLWPPARLWHRLTEPTAALHGDAQRRQARMLASFLLVIIGLFAMARVVNAAHSGFGFSLPPLVVYLVLFSAYGLSRTVHYRVAAGLAVAMFLLAPLWLVASQDFRNPGLAPTFAIPGLLLASILFSPRGVALFAVVNTVGVLLLPILAPNSVTDIQVVSSALGVNLVASALVIVAMVHRDRMERDRQAALRRSQERYRIVSEVASDFTYAFRLGADGALALDWVSEPFARVTGYSLEQVHALGGWTTLVHPDDRALLATALARLRSGSSATTEYRIRDHTGETLWLRDAARPIADGSECGVVQGYGAIRNVTEWVLAAAALRESDQRFRDMAENIREVFWLFDWEEQRPLYVSPAYEQVWGRAVQDLYARYEEWLESIHPDDRAQADTSFRQIPDTAGGEPREYRIVRPDGAVRWILDRGFAIRDEKGLVRRIAGIAEDITERRQARQALRESEQRYRTLVEDMPALVCRFLPDGTLTFVNAQYCRYFFRNREDLLGQDVFQFIPPEERQSVREHYASLTPARPVVSYEHQALAPDGSLRWQRWTDRALFDAQGDPVEYQSVGTDITERKQSEEALRASEEKYRRLFELESDAIFLVEKETGAILEANAAGSELYGYSREELLGMTNADLSAEPDATHAATQQEALTVPVRYHRKRDGTVFPVEITASHLEWQDRRVHIATIRDITARMGARQELERQRAFLRRVIDANPHYIYVKDRQGRVLLANQSLAASLGTTPEQLVGQTVFESVPDPAIAEAMYRDDIAVLTGEKGKVEREETYRDSAGDVRWAYTIKVPLADDAGDVHQLIGVSIDITDLKRAEAELRRSQQRLSQALRAANAGAWEWNMYTNRAIWSEQNYRVLGLQPGSAEASHGAWLDCVHPSDREQAERQLAQAIATEGDLNIEFRVVWPDGSVHWIHDVGRMMFDESGRPVGMYGIQMDVTPRKQAEAEREALIAELEAKNAELERFTYTASHDLKGPLITIKGFAGFLERDLARGNVERMQADIGRISEAADKMQTLLEELLELSRIGRMVNPPQAVPLGDLAREALRMLAGRLSEGNVEVMVSPDLPIIYVDRPRLRVVLENLFDNAIKFMGNQPQPQVELGVRYDGAQPVFYVRDNGVGIDPRYHDQIFGVFDKLDANSEGSGVGLTIAQRVIEVHGGRIWVESEGAGRGSSFCFTLPEWTAVPDTSRGNRQEPQAC